MGLCPLRAREAEGQGWDLGRQEGPLPPGKQHTVRAQLGPKDRELKCGSPCGSVAS